MIELEQGSNMLHIITLQYSLNTGLMNFKEQGKTAFTKKLKQPHILEEFPPVDVKKLKKVAEAVASTMLLTEKCNGEIKGSVYRR